MTFEGYLLALLATALVGLAIWMVTRYQASSGVLFYAGFLFGLAGIATAQALVNIPTIPLSLGLLITRLGYLSGVWTFSALLMFSWYYPLPNKHAPDHLELFWLIPLVFFAPFILLNPDFVKAVSMTTSGILEFHGQSYILFPAFVIVYVFLTLKNLVQKLHYVKSRQRGDMQVFIWALMITMLVGLVFDVVLPALGHVRIPIGIFSSSILFGLSTYIVAKR